MTRGHDRPVVVSEGANVLVAGTAIFGEREGVAASMDRLRAALNELSAQRQRAR